MLFFSTLEPHASIFNLDWITHKSPLKIKTPGHKNKEGLLLKATLRKPWKKDQREAAAMDHMECLISAKASKDAG